MINTVHYYYIILPMYGRKHIVSGLNLEIEIWMVLHIFRPKFQNSLICVWGGGSYQHNSKTNYCCNSKFEMLLL